MKKINVLYSGCSLSGKLTSIEAIAGSFSGNSSVVGEFCKNGWTTQWLHKKNYKIKFYRANFSLGDYYKQNQEIEFSDDVTKEIAFIKNIDGIIFVIDSQILRKEKNIESFNLLKQTIAYFDKEIDTIPIVFQINKRDLPEIYETTQIKKMFETFRCSYVETVGTESENIKKTVNKLIDLMKMENNKTD